MRVICCKTLNHKHGGMGDKVFSYNSNPCDEIFLDFITKDKVYNLYFDCRLGYNDYYKIYNLDGYYVGIFALDIDEYFISFGVWRDNQIDEILEC